MTLQEVFVELEQYGDAQTKKTHMNHGAQEPLFGVRVGDLKKILKKTKKNHALSLELFATGNSDAMYLAGLMADEKKISFEELDAWVNTANWSYLNEYAVPWVAAETPHAMKLAKKWLQSESDNVVCAGWSVLACGTMVIEDEQLDLVWFESLLDTIAEDIHAAQNSVKLNMNRFVIAVGSNVLPLSEKAIKVAQKIGPVKVDMDGTVCKVPLAADYIKKVIAKGSAGKKRKTARC